MEEVETADYLHCAVHEEDKVPGELPSEWLMQYGKYQSVCVPKEHVVVLREDEEIIFCPTDHLG